MSSEEGQQQTNASIEDNLQVYTTTWDGKATLKMLNMLFKNSVNTESPKSEQPLAIRLPLRPHQLAVINRMEELEKNSLIGYTYGDYKTFSNFGFIGDEVGTGKSLIVLGHIAKMKQSQGQSIQTNSLVAANCGHLFTIKTSSTKPNDSTLLVVPHTIFRQWHTYIKEHTTLKVFAMKTKANIVEEDDNKFANQIRDSDLVLISNTLYGDMMELAFKKNITWKRIFFDEADSIHISSNNKRPTAGFVWFISASWANFICHGSLWYNHVFTQSMSIMNGLDTEMKKWVKNELGSGVITTSTNYYNHYTAFRIKSPNYFRDYISNNIFRGLQVIRCREQFIEESMTMPPINTVNIVCEQPPQTKAVQGLVGHELQQMLNAGDIEAALEHLGVHAEEPTSLLEAFLARQQKELEQLNNELKYKEHKTYASTQDKEKSITKTKTKIQSVEQQIATFKERIETLKDELCPICYEELTNTIMTPCCNRVFCGQCMLTSLSKRAECPMCRTTINKNHLIHIGEKKENKKAKKEKTVKLLRKPEALLDFLVKNPTAKVLVFSRYENPFATLSLKCAEAGIDVFVLKGNKDCIANTIKEFEQGKKRVLFLPTQTAAAGMNLVAATHVLLYHQMTPEEERQVIGRAYRLGRKESLSVVKLVHENE